MCLIWIYPEYEAFDIPREHPPVDDGRTKEQEYAATWRISELYKEVLDRYPSMKEMKRMQKKYENGTSLNDIRKTLMASDEYKQLVKAQSNKVNDEVPLTMNNEQMKYEVAQAYRDVFGGKPSQTEMNYFVDVYRNMNANKNQLREYMNRMPSSGAGMGLHAKEGYLTKSDRNKLAFQIVCWFEEAARRYDKTSDTYARDVKQNFESRLNSVYPKLSPYRSQLFDKLKSHAQDTNAPTIKSAQNVIQSYLKGVSVSLSIKGEGRCRFSDDTLLTYPLDNKEQSNDDTINDPIEDPIDVNTTNTSSEKEMSNNKQATFDADNIKYLFNRPNITIYGSVPGDKGIEQMKQQSEQGYNTNKSKNKNVSSLSSSCFQRERAYQTKEEKEKGYLDEQKPVCGMHPGGIPENYYQKRSLDELRMKCKRDKDPYINADKWGHLREDQKWSVPQRRPPVCVSPFDCDVHGLPTQMSIGAAELPDAKNTKVGSLVND